MPELSISQWVGAALCALLIGFSKTGVPGSGILVIPLFAEILPARASTGALLPMLIMADVFAVAYYRRHAVWRHLVHLLPWAVVGVVLGAFGLKHVSDLQLRKIIGAVVLVMLALNYVWNRFRDPDAPIPAHWLFAASFGLVAGVVTMMANAAGPVMVIYLLAMRLPKNEFIGTGAWYFLLINCIKVPFHILVVGTITGPSLLFSAAFLPVITIGALLGVKVAQRIPEKLFNNLVQILAAVAALKLIF